MSAPLVGCYSFRHKFEPRLEMGHGSKTPVFGYHSGSERALIIPAFSLIPGVHKRTRENSGKSFKSIVNLRFRPNSIAVMGR